MSYWAVLPEHATMSRAPANARVESAKSHPDVKDAEHSELRFSADSGLAVYRDIAKIEAYQTRGLHYHDICVPQWLEDDKALFWGFWGRCFNDYRETKPRARPANERIS